MLKRRPFWWVLSLTLLVGSGAVWADSIEGKLEVYIADRETSAFHEYFVRTDNGERIRLRHSDPAGEEKFRSGQKVRATGRRAGAADFQTDSPTSVQITDYSGEAAALVSGPQRLLYIMGTLTDNHAQPYDVAYVQNLVFNDMNRFYQEASYGQVSFTGSATGWLALNISQADVCLDINRLTNAAKQAAQAAGYNLANYDRFIYAIPGMLSCSLYANVIGYSFIGSKDSWIFLAPPNLRVVGHEIAHQMGLNHTRSWDCSPDAFRSTGCADLDYGDPYSILGVQSVVGHFDPRHKEYFGWITPTLVTSTALYMLSPLEAPGGTKALKIPSSANGVSYTYYVSYRQPSAFSSVSDPTVLNGVVLHVLFGSGPNAKALDMTPATDSWVDLGLAAGLTYTDAGQGFSITPSKTDDGSINVYVNFPGSGVSSCDVNGDGATTITDIQYEVNQALFISPCVSDINGDGQCTIIDVQRITNAALGGQCLNT